MTRNIGGIMEKVKKTARLVLIISIAIMILSFIVARAVNTNGGKVTVKELKGVTDEGWAMSYVLYIPENATVETPAPCIVTSHGYYNNKEMQDANEVELARRGFVVIGVDQEGHGNSDDTTYYFSAVYQGALIASRLPYVDKERIGITGHSMGGVSSNSAVRADNASESPFISAVLLNCADATYQDNKVYANIYGTRDVAILAVQKDEFFHSQKDADGNKLWAPYFSNSPNAQSFLYFGIDASGKDFREMDKKYIETIDGEEVTRVIYRPNIIHPWSHFSKQATACVLDFFCDVLDAPIDIDANNQVWQWKEAFNFVGLIGMVMFICSLAIVLVFTKPFESLRADAVAEPMHLSGKKGHLWFWCGLVVSVAFATVFYVRLVTFGIKTTYPVFKILRQSESCGIGTWAFFCGVTAIVIMVVSYFLFGKKNGVDLKAVGVKMPVRKLLKSILFAFVVAGAAYAWIFVGNYFFGYGTDFRLWTLALKTFEVSKLGIAVPYLFMFGCYYVASSVANNCFNYNDLGLKKKGKVWNFVLMCVAVAFPALILPWIQYITYYATLAPWSSSVMYILWLFPMVIVLPTAFAISRVIYKYTRNPYIAGVINALIVTIMTVTNTYTVVSRF